MSATDDLDGRLAALLSAELGSPVAVADLRRLSSGASRETWAFTASWDGKQAPLILRRDPPGGGAPGGISRRAEMAVLAAAHRGGVAVPAVVCGGEAEQLGSPGFVMERIDGEALPQRLLRDDRYAAARDRLGAHAAQALARIHAIDPDRVPELGPPQQPEQLVRSMAALVDALGEPHPTFELAIGWLLQHLPPAARPGVVHGDFRTGNLLVDEEGLTAVLDWELAHAGDPAEDLGWFCTRAWRFGADDRPAGGFATRDELLAAYARAGGEPVDPTRLRFWEVYGTLRWGVITVAQASTHLHGFVRDVELAAIGRRTCETEHDLLLLLSGPLPAADLIEAPAPTGQDRPTMDEALDAVAGYLDDVIGDLSGRRAYLAKVSGRLLRLLEREVRFGPASAAADREGLADLLGTDAGTASLRELQASVAAAIRAGEITVDDAIAALRPLVARKLAIANPAYAAPRSP